MHNIKEAIYENKSKLEGLGEDYQIQVKKYKCYVFSEKPFCLEHQRLSKTVHLELTRPVCRCHVGQGSSTKDYFLHRTMQSLERYFYLIVFNAFLHEQVMRRREKPQNK